LKLWNVAAVMLRKHYEIFTPKQTKKNTPTQLFKKADNLDSSPQSKGSCYYLRGCDQYDFRPRFDFSNSNSHFGAYAYFDVAKAEPKQDKYFIPGNRLSRPKAFTVSRLKTSTEADVKATPGVFDDDVALIFIPARNCEKHTLRLGKRPVNFNKGDACIPSGTDPVATISMTGGKNAAHVDGDLGDYGTYCWEVKSDSSCGGELDTDAQHYDFVGGKYKPAETEKVITVTEHKVEQSTVLDIVPVASSDPQKPGWPEKCATTETITSDEAVCKSFREITHASLCAGVNKALASPIQCTALKIIEWAVTGVVSSGRRRRGLSDVTNLAEITYEKYSISVKYEILIGHTEGSAAAAAAMAKELNEKKDSFKTGFVDSFKAEGRPVRGGGNWCQISIWTQEQNEH